MHGAGIVHMVNMAVGTPNCCALLEMFPDPKHGYGGIQGHGNMAKSLGELSFGF